MYLLMAILETIFSYSSLENQLRKMVQLKLDSLSHGIESMASLAQRGLTHLQEMLREEKHYLYFDGQQFIPTPEILINHLYQPVIFNSSFL